MRILFVVWNLYPNTAYTNRTKATVRGLVECGHECDVLSVKPTSGNEPICVEGQKSTNKTSFLWQAWLTLCNIKLLERTLKKYDVVYCATGDQLIVRKVLKLSREYGKAVVHERTEFPDIFYGKSGKAQKRLANYLKAVGGFDHLFVISYPIKKYFAENGMPKEKISIYPMIVDPNRFTGIKKRDLGFRYIAYCGNLSNSKDGVADLIEAFGRSKAKDTHKLMLIGAKPSIGEMENYESLILKHSISKQVVFRGNVSRDEMPQILTDADLLVLCRPDNRQALGGFPTKLGEYLSTGNPVLVTKVGDIDKYIVDGKNGYLSAPDDIEAFSKKIDNIFANYDLSRKVGEKGKMLAYNEFNYSVQTKQVVNQLEKIL